MACHTPGLIVAHMRFGPLKAYHVLGQIMAQISSGPLRGFGLNYGPYQIWPVNWTLCFWAHLLKAHFGIRLDISFDLLRARLTFRPYINFGLLKACHIVGPNYGPVYIRPARSRYLIGPNKDRDNFGLLKARDLIRTIMGRVHFGLLLVRELFGTFQAQPTSQPPKSPLSFLAKRGSAVYSAY